MAEPARSLAIPSPTFRTRLTLLAPLALAAVLWCGLVATPAGAKMIAVGEPAGDFRLQDLEGQAVHLQQLLSERAALVLFSSVGCIPCEESSPAVQLISERFSDQLQVLCVMLSEPAKVSNWLAGGDRYPGARVLVGPDGDAPYGTAKDYGVLGTPTTFLVGRDGTVHWRHVGRISDKQFDEAIPAILAAAVAYADADLVAQRSEP